MPYLIKTELGWIVCGKVNSQQPNRVLSCNAVTNCEELDSMLKCFWEIEEFSQNKTVLTEEECQRHYVENTAFDESGRVKVRLPFKSSPNKLGSSFEVARRRFLYLEKRFLKDEVLQRMYIDFMNEYIILGHMSKVSNDVLN